MANPSMRIPCGLRADSMRTPNASRAGALHHHHHHHLHSIIDRHFGNARAVDNSPTIVADAPSQAGDGR